MNRAGNSERDNAVSVDAVSASMYSSGAEALDAITTVILGIGVEWPAHIPKAREGRDWNEEPVQRNMVSF
jgi:hypothetical protein